MAEISQVMEDRREEMVSLTGSKPTLRLAHFLAPSVTSIDGPVFDLPSNTYFPGPESNFVDIFKKSNLKVNFPGWRNPQKDWLRWVDHMSSTHHAAWKKAGIFDAIMNSTYTITRIDGLIFGFSEKWCPETNTFVFPWGESTITLEDMMILGGYSVLGDPVFRPVDTEKLAATEKKLLSARSELARSKAKKVSQSLWLPKFMDSGSEIEHEAFLALWLSRFVFRNKSKDDTIPKNVIPIAIHLARGTKIALAPAILANLYASLSDLKGALVDSRRMEDVSVFAPFQLVQIWIWERFPTLRPTPITIEHGQPRFAKWNGLRMENIVDVNSAIDEAADHYLWRPYAMDCNSSLPHMIYKENEQWALVGPDMDEDLEALVRCLRVSELVGLDLDCIMQYLPHRVAMQFGIDQDLPGHVARANMNENIAWENYTRAVRDECLYIPSRLFEPDVTTRYMEWWKKSISTQFGDNKASVTGVKYAGLKINLLQKSLRHKSCSDALASRSLHRECNTDGASGSLENAIDDEVSPKNSGKRVLSSAEKDSNNILLVSPGFPPKPNPGETCDSEDKDQQIQAKRLRIGTDGINKGHNIVRLTGAEYKNVIAKGLTPKSFEKQKLLNSDEEQPNHDAVSIPGFLPKPDTLGTTDLEDEEEQTRVKRLRNETDGKGKAIDMVRLNGVPYMKALANLASSKSLGKSMLLNSAGRKSDNDGSVSPGFPPKHNTVGTKDSNDKDGQFQNKSLRNGADGEEKSQKYSQLKSPISSTAESTTVQKMQVETSEIELENEIEKRSSKTVLGHEMEGRPKVYLMGRLIGCGSQHKCENSATQAFFRLPFHSSLPNVLKEANGSEAVIHQEFRINRGNGNGCNFGALHGPARKLEARIGNIERIVAWYKGGS